MNNTQRHYSTKATKMERVLMILVAVFLLAMIGLNVFVKNGPEPDMVFSTVNEHIEWAGAGYNGIWQKGN